jgi:5-formyltetrahydrofolate cyclo-ligase
VETLLSEEWYLHTLQIFVYAAIRSEVDLTSFCERAWRDGKKLFFPKVYEREMVFYRVNDWKQLKKGTFSVSEPDPHICKEWDGGSEQESVILVPGVAFSGEGCRIGYGGGYYDRFLEKHGALYTVGICFEEQLVEAITPQAHDIGMREIVTDQNRLVM